MWKKNLTLSKTNHGYSKKKYWNSLLKIQNYSQQQTHLWNDDTNKNLKIERKKIWKSPWFPQNLVRTTPGSFFPFIFLSEILVPYKKVSMIKKEKWKIWKKHVKKKQILEHDDIVITTNKNWAVNKQQHATAF